MHFDNDVHPKEMFFSAAFSKIIVILSLFSSMRFLSE